MGSQHVPHHPRLLLLLEDEPSIRVSLCEVLHADYEVQAFADGEQAWQSAQQEPPDLVLVDVLAPGLDGIGLTRRLRAEPRTATIPIILLTAGNQKTLLREGLDAGADDFLLKPFSPQELLVRLRSHRQIIELRREAASRQSDERFRLIVESARDYAIFTFDAQRRVTSWNPGAEVMTGYSEADMLGQAVDLLYTVEDRDRGVPAAEMQQAHSTGHVHNERWHLRKDGSRFWGSGVVMPMRESAPEPSSLKILRDFTAAHQAEQAHRRAEDRFSLVVQSISDYAIYLLDPEGRVTSWNPGAERIKGYKEEEIIGQHFSVCFTPEAIATGRPAKELEIAAREGRFHEEDWRVRKNGERYWGDELIVPLRNDNGDLTAFARFCRDLTERKRQEDERTRLLASEQAARQEAEAANRTKDRFLAALSHELRTPLMPVQIALHVMGREKGLPPAVLDGIEMIRRNVKIEAQLIGDLLDVSHIVHGKLEMKLEPMDLHRCIRQALEICREDFVAKNLKLTLDLNAKDHRVIGESSRLQQVLWNLFQNAAKFTPENGEITVCSSNPDGRSIEIVVSDTGMGIEAEDLPKIFAPFEQGDPDKARLHGGLGLGLAIAHAIVAAHGGRLTAESAGHEHGATFRATLSTMAKAAPGPSAPGISQDEPPLRT